MASNLANDRPRSGTAGSGDHGRAPADTDQDRRRFIIYLALVLCGCLLILVAALLGPEKNPRILYLCTLLAVCGSPVLFVRRANGPFAVLYIFMAIYYLFFAADDLLNLVVPGEPTGSSGIFSLPEVAILVAGILTVAAYRLAVPAESPAATGATVQDWNLGIVLAVGLVIWIYGMASTWIWQVDIIRRAFDALQNTGTLKVLLVTAGRLVHPLGPALLAYAFIVSRKLRLAPLILAMVLLEFALGFVEDSKEIAVQAGVIVLMAKFLIDGRIPKSWMLAAALTVTLTFPVFQAYRAEVLQLRGEDRAQAALELGKNLDLALHADTSLNSDSNLTLRSFVNRVSYKPTIELIVERVGTAAPFQHGKTLAPLLSSFVPRFLWPDKPDLSVGQYFNRELHISDAEDTYISTTMLGEMYWNFGWFGIVAGFLVFGYGLGFIDRRCELSSQPTVTKFLILVVTLYTFGARFEDGIAMGLTLWLRSMVVIALLHAAFSGRRHAVPAAAEHDAAPVSDGSGNKAVAAFPNLMR